MAETKPELKPSVTDTMAPVVRPRRFVGDDSGLVAALKQRHPEGMAAVYQRYGDHVLKVLTRILGVCEVLPELTHEVFIEAYSNIRRLKDAHRLKAWLTSIAVFTARGYIRKNRLRRFWVRFEAPEALPDLPGDPIDAEARQSLQCLYSVLEQLPTNERIAFSLRFIEGMNNREVAEVCRVSTATVKRRLARATKQFLVLAEADDALRPWIDNGSRWRER